MEAAETSLPEELLVHLEPWCGSEDPALTKQLLQQDIDGGHLFEIPGGQAAARSCWGKLSSRKTRSCACSRENASLDR